MEPIIKKAIEGGWMGYNTQHVKDIVDKYPEVAICDHTFWQALGKACGWQSMSDGEEEWVWHARIFYVTNLTEGWEKGVEYLSELVK